MHEASLADDLVRKAEQVARAEGAVRVTSVTVRVGGLCHLTSEHLCEHFTEAARGTIVEGSAVKVVEGPGGDEGLADPHSMDLLLLSVDVEGGG